MLFPTQLAAINGPRLEDAEKVAATPGAQVNILYGTYAIAGFRMWLGDVTEHSTTTTEGGKGSEQSSTSYSYTQPIAIGLCEGPILALSRIWENGELVYDIREPQEGESDDEYAARASASAAYQETFTIYPGDEDQEADPTMEFREGVGNVPGFRGLAYLVYHDRVLRDDQAQRHPTFKFEVAAGGTLTCVETTQYSNEVLYPWLAGAANPNNVNVFHAISTGVNLSDGYPGSVAGDFATDAEALEAIRGAAPRDPGSYIGYAAYDVTSGFDQHWGYVSSMPFFDEPYAARSNTRYLHYNKLAPSKSVWNDGSISGDAFLNNAGGLDVSAPSILMNGYFSAAGFSSAYAGVFVAVPSLTGDRFPPYDIMITTGSPGVYYGQSYDAVVGIDRSPGAPRDPCEEFDNPAPLFPGYCIDDQGRYVRGGPWDRDTSTNYCVLNVWGEDDGGVASIPLNPCLPQGDANSSDEAFWTAAYDQAVLDGLIPAGYTYVDPASISYTDPGLGKYPRVQNFGYVREARICTISLDEVSLSSIVSDLCLREGLGPEQIEVADLEDVLVNGYLIGSVMAGRSAIDPLRSVGWFDVVEDPPVLKFVRRGGPVRRTLEIEDLGATDAENGEDNSPALTTKKLQDVELPRTVRVKYVAPSRDYDAGEQISPSRLTTDATNDTDLSIAIAISDAFAAQIAEVVWADAWRSRWTHTLSLDSSSLELEPADVIEVPVDGRLQRMRITAIEDAEGLVRKMDLSRDDDGSYVSQAVAAAPNRPTSQVNVRRASELILMDLPPLRDLDNDPGVYATAIPTGSGTTWRGGVISKSTDLGASWATVGTVLSKPTAGRVVTPAWVGITTTWDSLNSLVVDLASGEFESKAEEAVLNGANAVAVGVDGRWEVLQFLDAEEIAPDRWRLTNLLRGRRGTERFVGTGVAGDYAVLVSGAGIVRVAAQNDELGADRLYRAVTLGSDFGSGTDVTFASRGVALLPFSPIDVAVEVSGVDFLISWRRRDRLSQELRSGSDMPMSEATESYAVRIYAADGTTLLRTLAASTNAATYTGAMRDDDLPGASGFVVGVAQLSALVGAGPEGREAVAIVPAPAVEHTLTFAFSGSFDTTQSFDAVATFTPTTGSAVVSSHRVTGSGKASITDYATDLAALFDADLPGAVVVSIVGDSVVLTTSSGVINGSVQALTEYAVTYQRQAALPAQSGRAQILVVDLWSDLTNGIRAPDTASAYGTGGIGTISWVVNGITYDVDEALNYGKSQAASWSIPSPSGNRLAALAGLCDKIGYGSQGTGNVAQANLKDYIGGCTLGLSSGTSQARSAVAITLKPGYFIGATFPSATAGAHPSGYALVTEEVQSAIADFPSGAKQKTSIYFTGVYDSSGFVTGLFDGQVLFVDIDAHHYTHTVTSGEASDPATQYNAGSIYDDFKTLIEADGECVVTIRDSLDSGGTSYHVEMSIERNVANTPFTYAAGSDFGLAIALSTT